MRCRHCLLTLSDVKLSSSELIVVKDRMRHLCMLLRNLRMLLVVAKDKGNVSEALHGLHASGYTAMND